jgi:hypothetical protein
MLSQPKFGVRGVGAGTKSSNNIRDEQPQILVKRRQLEKAKKIGWFVEMTRIDSTFGRREGGSSKKRR